MASPYNLSIMPPLLKLAADNYAHQVYDALDPLADRLRLTDEEKRKLATVESAPLAG